jgi:hypothetical protein
METTLLYKYQLLEQVDVLKFAWVSEFTKSIELSEEEFERCLVIYVNINDEVDDTLN